MTTSQSAECTICRVVTARIAAADGEQRVGDQQDVAGAHADSGGAGRAGRGARAGRWAAATSFGSAAPGSGAGGGGTVGIHWPEPVLLVQQVLDVELGVLELRAPVQRVERADLDADPAVHAEREVDGEAVQDVALRSRPPGVVAGSVSLCESM